MNLQRWTTTGVAAVAAVGLSVLAGCEQEANESYEFPDTPVDTRPGLDSDTNTNRDFGDVGPMGTDQEGTLGAPGNSAAPGSPNTGSPGNTNTGGSASPGDAGQGGAGMSGTPGSSDTTGGGTNQGAVQ